MELALEMGRGAGKVAQKGAPTLATAMEVYLARPKLRSDSYKQGVRAYMDNQLKDWLRVPLDEISKSMVVHRHQQMAANPSTANHALRYFRSIYNHARRTHDLPECPTMAIEWYEEKPDGRIIENLVDWRQAVDALDNPIHRAFYELMLFTGLRKGEAMTLEWKNIHADRIHLPMTKNGRSFDLPILPVHHDILAPLESLSSKWVFPSPKSSAGHITGTRKLQWSPHAHRRTFATVAMEVGVLEEVVGRLLNHTPLSITGQRYTMPSLDALRPAMEVVCAGLAERQSG
jgi:integrase